MVSVDDLEKLAEPPTKSTLLSKYNIPLNYLDFAYVEKCTNAREMERILHILQSGEEGYYPQLLEAAESRLELLKPTSKYLRKEIPVVNSKYLPKNERQDLQNDLSDFVETVKRNDDELTRLSGRERDVNLPDIRKYTKEVRVNEITSNNNATRIKSTDYESWDRYDVDTEILKLDLTEQRLQEDNNARIIDKTSIPTKKTVRFKPNLTEAERINEADREREKGNEYYKAGDYLDAYNHYTRSISAKQTVAALTNRALVDLKLLRFHDAIEDCKQAINKEPDNVKANLRLGQAYEGLKRYDNALDQAEVVVRIDANNTAAQTLANNCYRNLIKKGKDKTTRLKITEINEDTPTEISNKKGIVKKQKLKKSSPKILKAKSSKYEIISLPGTSKMKPPYFVRIEKSKLHEQVVIRRENNVSQNQVLLHVGNVYHNSNDDDDDCTVIHINPKKDKEKSSFYLDETTSDFCKDIDIEKDTNISHCDRNNEKDIIDNKENASKLMNEVAKINKSNHTKIQVEATKINQENSRNAHYVEVLAARTTVTATLNEKGGSGEPHNTDRLGAQRTEPRDDVHMPYIFVNTWNCIREDQTFAQHASILRTLDLRNLPQIIGCKLDGTMLSELLQAAYRHMTVADEVWRVHDFVEALPRIARYTVVRLFMTAQDEAHLNNLVQFLEQHGRPISARLRKELME